MHSPAIFSLRYRVRDCILAVLNNTAPVLVARQAEYHRCRALCVETKNLSRKTTTGAYYAG